MNEVEVAEEAVGRVEGRREPVLDALAGLQGSFVAQPLNGIEARRRLKKPKRRRRRLIIMR